MPVKAYIGEPRSGKTYELASVVILQALKQGRRVVSNIAGLNHDAYVELIRAENPDIEKIGDIINLQHDEVLNPDFWITDLTANDERHERQLQRGDFLVLDEIWRFWDGFAVKDSEGNKKPPQVKNFFRMHGQMPHPKTGFICEIALITQQMDDIHRSVRGIINQTYFTEKLTALGLTKRYRLDIYHKHYVNRKPLNSFQKEYNSKFFNLYQSHSTKQEGDADAKEVTTDTRGNMLKGKIFIALFALLFVSGFAFYFLWGFFHPKPKEGAKNEVIPNQPVQTQQQNQNNNVNSLPKANAETWRVVGHYKTANRLTLVLENNQGITRYLPNPQNFRFDGLNYEAILNDGVFTNYIYEKSNNAPNTPNPANNF